MILFTKVNLFSADSQEQTHERLTRRFDPCLQFSSSFSKQLTMKVNHKTKFTKDSLLLQRQSNSRNPLRLLTAFSRSDNENGTLSVSGNACNALIRTR